MAATNRTPSERLSQFTEDDKPSFLGDYNSDMKKIDDGFVRRDNTIATLQAQLSDALTRVAALEKK